MPKPPTSFELVFGRAPTRADVQRRAEALGRECALAGLRATDDAMFDAACAEYDKRDKTPSSPYR